jgi:YfiH family protein
VSAEPKPGVQPDPAGRRVAEIRAGDFPLYVHPDWASWWPWLVQGTTARGQQGLDLGLFGTVPVGEAMAGWRRLREAVGMGSTVHARQVHGAKLLWHVAPCGALGLHDGADGHATAAADLLLTVSVADCVPIFVVSPERRAVALLHGGWRGIAAGILEAGIEMLCDRTATRPAELHVHCGPAICGECYEVGPEVMLALGADTGGRKAHLDVRAHVANRARTAGIAADRITLSTHCTRCGGGVFWSHRGGCAQRQLGVLGLRPPRA